MVVDHDESPLGAVLQLVATDQPTGWSTAAAAAVGRHAWLVLSRSGCFGNSYTIHAKARSTKHASQPTSWGLILFELEI